ncbi:alpha/beta fold hydrolase [Nocardia goodfellowii]|uniref:Pimeloyl-ACP methyl ester carboxylesterase n=1 Tax=Nocardia goodfellowii TaxID=882446 RepID=A0ABS4QDZ0_9NOCA|nr:alpha/beta hydrolase [Nocardia goodfellowii]MBP2189899.1 pimeloyl-ACP methyl ester carboxylesterase [Nocardia goodfellowii]
MPIVDMTLGEVTLRATVSGTGPTVLMLHAGGERRSVWEPVAARMNTSGLRTVAYDLRGHGESSGRVGTLRAIADDVREMVRREPEPIVLVGASLGGLAAMAALAEPSVMARVAGLVLVDVVPDADPDRVRRWRDDHGLREQFTELVEDILGSSKALLTIAAELDLPILLVRAGRQTPLGDTDVDRFRAANHRVTVTCVPEAGHLVARDAPAELARLVVDHARLWLATDDAVSRAFELQQRLGAGHLDHPGGTLHTHLHRVHALTVEWNATPRTRLAAICHATYGTDGFAHALLPIADRSLLRHVIGSDAEALVYLYGAGDRTRTYPGLGRQPLPIFDRFTGRSRAVQGSELRDFAVLTIANELDVARHAQLPAPVRHGIRSLVAALASYAPDEAAFALADEALR